MINGAVSRSTHVIVFKPLEITIVINNAHLFA